MLQPLLLLSLLAAQTIWTVDDDGPADFATVIDALAAAQPGDILSIAPGNYAGVTIDKRMSLIGQQGASLPQIKFIDVVDASAINLRRLGTERLTVTNVAGFSRVEECEIRANACCANTAMIVEDAEQLLVRQCEVIAQGETDASGGIGMIVTGNSRVHMVQCEVRGADAWYSEFWAWAGWGGDALIARDQSHITIVASVLQGGGGKTWPGGVWPISDPDIGLGGDGITVDDNAYVDVRGSSAHLLSGGYQELDAPSMGINGKAVDLASWTTTGTAEHGGVSVVGDTDGQWVDARPFLTLDNQGFPGGIARSATYGEAGQVGVLVSSFSHSLLEMPAYGPVHLWVDPFNLFGVQLQTLAGFDTAATHSYNLPAVPNLVGVTLQLQAAQVSPVGAITLTNATSILVGL